MGHLFKRVLNPWCGAKFLVASSLGALFRRADACSQWVRPASLEEENLDPRKIRAC